MATDIQSIGTLEELARVAHDQPVVSAYSDLAAHVLDQRHGITTIDGLRNFHVKLQDPTHTFESDVVVRQLGDQSAEADSTVQLDLDPDLTTYDPPTLPTVQFTGSAYSSALNDWVAESWVDWTDVSRATTCQSAIGNIVVERAQSADAVAVVIIDGLSFADWQQAGYDATPVYVDCPTITECGYPNVVFGGTEGRSLAGRVHDVGLTNRRAYTYWETSQSELTDRLHQSISPNDVVGDITDFEDVLTDLRSDPLADQGTFLQITLTGPERVAHRLKENPDVQNEVRLVKKKLDQLYQIMNEQVEVPSIIATADHGMLWRMHSTEFKILEGGWDHTKRRHLSNPAPDLDLPEEHGYYQQWDETDYFRLQYPYLFHDLRSNEPGTHGGFSFEESIVPLITHPSS